MIFYVETSSPPQKCCIILHHFVVSCTSFWALQDFAFLDMKKLQAVQESIKSRGCTTLFLCYQISWMADLLRRQQQGKHKYAVVGTSCQRPKLLAKKESPFKSPVVTWCSMDDVSVIYYVYEAPCHLVALILSCPPSLVWWKMKNCCKYFISNKALNSKNWTL